MGTHTMLRQTFFSLDRDFVLFFIYYVRFECDNEDIRVGTLQ